MSKYFKDVTSLENLKSQFVALAKKNHPDVGGDVETMQEINVEFDALFAIWKLKQEKETGKDVQDTAESTRRTFYTQNGWAGNRYDVHLSTKEITKAIRTYCKEKYPTWKFSVRFESFSGGSSIDVCLMEAPVDIFDREYFSLPMNRRNDYWRDFDEMAQQNSYYMQIHSMYGDRKYFNYLNDIGYEVLKDVFDFMMSYRYDDSDGMIDYFDTNFYYDFDIGKFDKGFKIVPKTARIQEKKGDIVKSGKSGTMENSDTEEISKKYDYKIIETQDTRDGSQIWIVKILDKLNKEDYIAENKAMKARGAYYSKYMHGFLFREDPTEILKTA